MKNKIADAAKPTLPSGFNLYVEDVSHKHAGHLHAKAEGSHFELYITGNKLTLKEKLALHKALNAALMPLYAKGIHSIEIKITQTD